MEGLTHFNKGDIYKTHLIWEHIWKNGNDEIRRNIKGWIQLTGGLIKRNNGKDIAAKYLLTKAVTNIQKAKWISQIINTQSTINQVNNLLYIMGQGENKSVKIVITEQ